MVFHCRMLIMPYGTESKSRNADFMFIAGKGDTTTLGLKGRQTYEPSGPKDRSILRTLGAQPR